MPFLENVTRGRNIPRERLAEVAHHYELFGGVSPINRQNRELIAALERRARRARDRAAVYFGNRNWHPFLADTLREMRDDGVRRALAFFTSAFSSYSGCRQYREDIYEAQAAVGPDAPEVLKLRAFYNHPGFVEANADRVRDALARDPEERRAARTSRSPRTASRPRWRAMPLRGPARRDRAARRRGRRREPGTRSSTRAGAARRRCRGSSPTSRPSARLPRAGVTDVVVSPVGFVSDHIEVLFDLDVEAASSRRSSGCTCARRTAGTHPAFVAMIRELVAERLDPTASARVVGRFGPEPRRLRRELLPPGTGRPPPGTPSRRPRASARQFVSRAGFGSGSRSRMKSAGSSSAASTSWRSRAAASAPERAARGSPSRRR